jgi:phage baseplate assembly protein W
MTVSAEERILGRDIYLSTDLAPDGRGGVATVAGLANLRQAIERLLLSSPGDIYHRPDYGVGLRDFLNKPVTDMVGKKIKARVREVLSLEPRIALVQSVSVAVTGDNALVVSVVVVAAGTTLPVVARVAP